MFNCTTCSCIEEWLFWIPELSKNLSISLTAGYLIFQFLPWCWGDICSVWGVGTVPWDATTQLQSAAHPYQPVVRHAKALRRRSWDAERHFSYSAQLDRKAWRQFYYFTTLLVQGGAIKYSQLEEKLIDVKLSSGVVSDSALCVMYELCCNTP